MIFFLSCEGVGLGLQVLFALCLPLLLDFKTIYSGTISVKENISSKLPHTQRLNGTKVHLVKAMVVPVVIYGCESGL